MPAGMTRRQLLVSAGAAAGVLFTAPRRAKAAPRAKIEAVEVISKQPELYCGWPTLARQHDGRLLLAYSGGREEHVCPFGRVELMHSDDGGRSWTWPRVLLDSAIDDRDAGVIQTRSGVILVTTFTSLAWEPILERAEKEKSAAWPAERLQRWRAVRARLPAARRQSELGQWLIRSTDGGITFSARLPTPVNSPHGPIQLSDGRLLYLGNELWTGQRRVGACESRDEGLSWRWLAEIPVRPGDTPKEYWELHAVEAADGRIVAHIRNHNPANNGETLQTESFDGGQTWSVPRAIGVWGLPSHLLRLKDGRLLMSYGHRRQPLGNQARLSTDHGRTWSEPLILSADGVTGDLGYPSTVQLDDGALVTVWYEVMKGSPRAVLRQARWRIEG